MHKRRWEFRLRRTYKGVRLGRVGISWYAIDADTDLDGKLRDLWIADSYAGAKRWVNCRMTAEQTDVIPLCSTCRLWGQEACRRHQRPRGRRGCPGCGGRGFITFMSMSQSGAIEAGEEPCLCTRSKGE